MNKGSGYAPKMDKVLTNAMKDWYNNLSKEELLAYLADQPTVTADTIRQMLSGMDCVLTFDVRFSANTNDAITDFHTK